MAYSDAELGSTVVIHIKGETGLCFLGSTTATTMPTDAGEFEPGALLVSLNDKKLYINTGTTASPSWNDVAAIGTSDIADGAVTAAKVRGSEARTATSDGTTTGAITAPSTYVTVVTVTSAAATDQIALPAITSASVGQIIYLNVGANGYELITPASSNNTINLVDADGTNQLDVAANTTVRATCVSTTSWLCETIAATTIAVTAPDND